MKNRKLVILIILWIVAIASLIYGIVSEPRIKRGLSVEKYKIGQIEKVQLPDRIIPTKRHARRTEFNDWSRNPFAPAKRATGLILNGIVWDEETPRAIIGDVIVGIGDKVKDATVVDIKRESVVLRDDNGEFELIISK